MTVEALIDLGNASVRVTSVGSGPPLLIMASAGGTGTDVLASLAPLADIVRVVGYQSSDADDEPRSEPDLHRAADKVEMVRTALGLGDIIVFGHSLGVLVAVEYARRWQQHVAGVALCLAGVDIADPLAEIDAPALVIATAHPMEIAHILRPWLQAEVVTTEHP